MAWTSPATWVAGAVVTAAQLNAQIRDNLKAIGDPWTAYTPTWTSTGTAPALGNGTLTGAYLLRGKTVDFKFFLTMGSTSTYGTGTYRISLPVAAIAATAQTVMHSTVLLTDTGVVSLTGALRYGTTTTVELLHPNAAADTRNNVAGPSAPWTWGSTDTISGTGTYEAA